MPRYIAFAISILAVLAATGIASAQQAAARRLPASIIDVMPPSQRVTGEMGKMQARATACRNMPIAETRRRIVNIAVQEWAFFGFPVLNAADDVDEVAERSNATAVPGRRGGRFAPLPLNEITRVASSVAGYWAVTPLGPSMIANQNREWNGPEGINGRWADPWSAAFISWVMCEAGLGNTSQFQRSIAHWNYIDQAIAARDGRAPNAAYVAYNLGEENILPGDMLCSGRRPAYTNLAERRRQTGVGARTHCDIVVQIDEKNARILTVGGNVRRAVSVKLFPAAKDARGNWRPVNPADSSRTRSLFAHLKLRAEAIEFDALKNSPTIGTLGCQQKVSEPRSALNLFPAVLAGGSC